MIRRRLTIALVTAASTSLALFTPIHAEETTEGSVQGLTSVSSLSSTTGSTTTEPDGEEPEDEKPPVLPGWGQSLEMGPETELAFEIIKALFAVGLAATQAAVIVLPLIPGGVDQLRSFLNQFGIRG